MNMKMTKIIENGEKIVDWAAIKAVKLMILVAIVMAFSYHYGIIGVVKTQDGLVPKVANLSDYQKVYNFGVERGRNEIINKPWYSRVFNPGGEK